MSENFNISKNCKISNFIISKNKISQNFKISKLSVFQEIFKIYVIIILQCKLLIIKKNDNILWRKLKDDNF